VSSFKNGEILAREGLVSNRTKKSRQRVPNVVSSLIVER